MDKERIQKLKVEAEQNATRFFEAYHQAIGASLTYGNMLKEIEEDEIAEQLTVESKDSEKE